MVNALLYKLDFPNSYLGKIAENALFTHIVRLRLGEEFDPKVFYWDEGEIDFVFTLKGERFLVELKYQNEVREKDLANIKRFLDMHEARHIFLVTKNQYGTFSYKNRDIHVVPLFAFLMFRGL
jgi:predicted AAA+ superfamily ATPase